ncbi:MAG TPA: hypothetical protein VE175_01200 [Woeseiaceae bacterium]|nr:hypothetical protein [Woeseiaceae bacterium]
MVILTDSAIAAIRSLAEQAGQAGQPGLRIADPDGSGALHLSLSPGPEAGDEIIQAGGARVFLQPDAATLLDGMALDSLAGQKQIAFQVSLPRED